MTKARPRDGGRAWLDVGMDLPKFVPLEYVMEELSISRSQAYALVRSGELRAIRVGGRGQWRIDLEELEAFIQRKYAETEKSGPFTAR